MNGLKMSAAFNYGELMRSAMTNIIKTILEETIKSGLIDNQHFFINFETSSTDVVISPRLKEQYPNEMSIIIKNWYTDLAVSDDYFSITLNFSNVPENLRIPFKSIISFSDPSVDFVIKPNDTNNNINPDDLTKELQTMGEIVEEIENNQESKNTSPSKKKGEVVNIENFRKNR